MNVNWVRAYNRLFEIINTEEPTYFSGSRFISKVREVDPYFANYNQYIEERQNGKKSTSRKDYFYDILLSFDETHRHEIIGAVLNDVREHAPEKVAALEKEVGVLPKSDASIPAGAAAVAQAQTIVGNETSLVTNVPSIFPNASPTSTKVSTIRNFWNDHWQWVIGTAVAIASVVAAFLKG